MLSNHPHVIPVGDYTMFNGVLNTQNPSLDLGLISDIIILETNFLKTCLQRFFYLCYNLPLPLQYISLLSILASALLMMSQRFGIIYLMMYVQPLLSTHSERNSKAFSLHQNIHSNLCFSRFLSMVLTPVRSQVNDYRFMF